MPPVFVAPERTLSIPGQSWISAFEDAFTPFFKAAAGVEGVGLGIPRVSKSTLPALFVTIQRGRVGLDLDSACPTEMTEGRAPTGAKRDFCRESFSEKRRAAMRVWPATWL